MSLIIRYGVLEGFEQNKKNNCGGNVSETNIREDGQYLRGSGAKRRLFCRQR
jgi:hypothetical protein